MSVVSCRLSIGGGWQPDAYAQTYGPFLRAATPADGRKIVLVTASEAEDEEQTHGAVTRYQTAFEALGAVADELAVVVVSATRPFRLDTLRAHAPTGVFVCGGLTPLYHHALCADLSWLDYLRARHMPETLFRPGVNGSLPDKGGVPGA